jgi:uncharacterized protein (TIGR02996 family)
MANLEALYSAVVADPENDAPRLAYADAVAAAEPSRAELIRLQVQLAHWRKGEERPPGRGDAAMRAGELIRAHAVAWAADVQPLVAKCIFMRGFVEHVAMDAGAFLQSAPELYGRAPVLHLDLTGVAPVSAELFGSPHLARIHSLGLARQQLGDGELTALADSLHLGKLAWLDLWDNQIGAAGLEALAASVRLPRLSYVGFAYNLIEDPTPRFADDYDTESELARRLQQTYGYRPWLSAHTRASWPPERDEVWKRRCGKHCPVQIATDNAEDSIRGAPA